MIYLLEDDDSIRELVIYTLNSQGMEARGFGLPSEFWQAVAEAVEKRLAQSHERSTYGGQKAQG